MQVKSRAGKGFVHFDTIIQNMNIKHFAILCCLDTRRKRVRADLLKDGARTIKGACTLLFHCDLNEEISL